MVVGRIQVLRTCVPYRLLVGGPAQILTAWASPAELLASSEPAKESMLARGKSLPYEALA